MFALRTDNQAKKPDPRKPARADPTLGKKAAPAPNPFWQSLALRPVAMQAKLAISQPDDPYEREADQMAERVMRMATPPGINDKLSFDSGASLQAQRKCAGCEEEEENKLQRKEQDGNPDSPTAAPPIVHEALNSPSQPVDPATRGFMESHMGQDFSQVRVHTNALAAEAASAIGSRAYTVNHDIVFGAGEYNPQSNAGRQLLSHELTHVIQQRGVAEGVQRQSTKDKPVKGATSSVPPSGYRWDPGGAPRVPGQPLTAVTTYGTTVPTEKLKLVEVNVATARELVAAALRPDTKAVHIVGSLLEYFKNHKTTHEIRRDFFIMLEGKIRDTENMETKSGKVTDTYGAGLRTYGSIYTSPVSTGTWMIGKTDQPTINYEMKYSRLAPQQWNVDWKAKWKIIDDFDFRPGKDKSWVYNVFATIFGPLWHDVLGGKEDLPVHLEWEESGSYVIQPPTLPSVTTYGKTITSPGSENVRR